MTKHRKFLLLAAVVGIISMSLPWWEVCHGNICAFSYNGFNFMGLDAGVFVALAFLGTGALSFLGDKGENLDPKLAAITLSCGGTAAAIILRSFNRYEGSLWNSEWSFGAYLAAMAAIAIPLSLLAVWFFKPPHADSEI